MALNINLHLRSLSRLNINNRYLQTALATRCNSTAAIYLNYDKQDPAKFFFDTEIQKLLSSITRIQLNKVFRKKTVPDNHVSYKFLTDKQVEQEIREKFSVATKLLQMPPVLKVIDDSCKVLSSDKGIKNFSPYTHVFTDVSFGLKNNERSVVIRKPDGVLQEAPFEIKKRVWQIYFPMKNRSFHEPKMFEQDNLKRLLNEHQYEFILDMACNQYEPYELSYHQISSQVYQHINEHLQFEALRSTRHFGPMAFFFAWNKIIDELLLDMIRNDYLKNGVELIYLMFKLNNIKESTEIIKKIKIGGNQEEQIKNTVKSLLSRDDSIINKIDKSNEDLRNDEICFEYIQDYVKKYSQKKAQLELVLQTYKEWHNELKTIQSEKIQTN